MDYITDSSEIRQALLLKSSISGFHVMLLTYAQPYCTVFNLLVNRNVLALLLLLLVFSPWAGLGRDQSSVR